MQSIIINYHLFSDKVEHSQRIVLISDLHDIFTNKKIVRQLTQDISELKAHHVAIAGDTMQGNKYGSSKKCNQLSYFLDGLSEAQPVVLSLGNHDLVGLTEEGRNNFRNLGNHHNTYPLDNQTLILDDFRISGFSTGRKAYDSANHSCGKANQLFAEEWNQSGIEVGKNSPFFEELVGHAPHPLASDYVGREALGIRNFDLYLTGHLHDGYVPYWYKKKHLDSIQDRGVWEMPIEKDFRGKITVIRPWVYTSTRLCRGMHFIGEGKMELENGTIIQSMITPTEHSVPLVISGGVNKCFSLPSHPEITCIDIHPKVKKLDSHL